jgi:two-component sensor histidine kinase
MAWGLTIMDTIAADPSAECIVLPALREPDMVDESNHRIANNLQLLIQMITLAARNLTDDVARDVLHMTTHRIAAMASLHRHLHQTRRADRVALHDYLGAIVTGLEQSFADPAQGRRVRLTADAVEVATASATAIGVITSELVANAWKHAYRADEPGEVHVTLRRERGGCGFSGEAGAQSPSLGMQLITMMSARIGGRLTWADEQPGTRFILRVPL